MLSPILNNINRGNVYLDMEAIHSSDEFTQIYQKWPNADETEREALKADAIAYFEKQAEAGTIKNLHYFDEEQTLVYEVDGIENIFVFDAPWWDSKNMFISANGHADDTPFQDTLSELKDEVVSQQSEVSGTAASDKSYRVLALVADGSDDVLKSIQSYMTPMLQKAPDIGFAGPVMNTNFTIGNLKMMREYDIVWFAVHGGYTDKPYMCTVEGVTETNLNEYKEYLDKHDIAVYRGMKSPITGKRKPGYGLYVIYGSFFQHLFSKGEALNTKWVHLSMCSGMRDDSFAQALYSVGVKNITGYSYVLHVTYDYYCLEELFPRLNSGATIHDAAEKTEYIIKESYMERLKQQEREKGTYNLYKELYYYPGLEPKEKLRYYGSNCRYDTDGVLVPGGVRIRLLPDQPAKFYGTITLQGEQIYAADAYFNKTGYRINDYSGDEYTFDNLVCGTSYELVIESTEYETVDIELPANLNPETVTIPLKRKMRNRETINKPVQTLLFVQTPIPTAAATTPPPVLDPWSPNSAFWRAVGPTAEPVQPTKRTPVSSPTPSPVSTVEPSSEGYDDSEPALQDRLIEEYTGDGELLVFAYEDYDGDGRMEGFALMGVYDDETFENSAELWYVCADHAIQCERAGGCYPSVSGSITYDGITGFRVLEGYFGSGMMERIWSAENETPYLVKGEYMLEDLNLVPLNKP